MATHTPGPYHVDDEPERLVVADESHRYLAVIAYDQRDRFPDDLANAALFAAAPDLLEACDKAQREMNAFGNLINWPSEMPMSYAQTINALRAAIARARREEE